MIYFYTAMGILGPLVIILCSLGVYFSFILNDKVKELDARRRKLLDQKSRVVSDSILSIKNIKFNSWEDIMMDRLTNLRKKDNSLLMKNFTIQGISTTIVSTIPTLIALITVFCLKIVIQKDISVSTIYVLILYLNQLKKNLIFINFGLIEINSALVSMKRIKCFLRIKDLRQIKQQEISLKNEEETKRDFPIDSGLAVQFDNCSLKWTSLKYKKQLEDLQEQSNEEKNSKKSQEGEELKKVENCLKDIDFSVRKGSFVCIVGQVGAGKSSLLKSLLGELTISQGGYEVNGSVGYIPQEAFLVNDTLRNNILFGKELDEEKYQRIIKMSQLRPDFEMLPAGDLTEIGEKGMNLSGGQKQRISIARALYSDSDIYLVDDCMSALDSHVGGAILEEVFFEHLKHKTIIMTTHRYHFLSRVDDIYVLKDGEIITGGPYEQIKETKEIQQFVKIENLNHDKVEEFTKKSQSKNPKTNKKEDRLDTNSHRAMHCQKILNQESKRIGSLKFDVFKFYFSKGGTWLCVIVYILFTLSSFFCVLSDFWAGSWISELFYPLSDASYGLIALSLMVIVALT